MNSEMFAASVVNTLRESMLVLDRDLRVQSASPSFYRTFQVTKEQTIGVRIFELGNHQWDIPALRRLLEEILPRDGEFEDYLIASDFPAIGRRTMMLNARRLHDNGTTEFILVAIEDVTERRKAELEVARQREWFQTTLSSIGDAVIATDAETDVTFMNPVAERMTGWMQGEALGKPLDEVFRIVNEETRNTVDSPVTKAIRRGAIVGLANHTLLIARDGSEHPIDDSAAPIRNEDQAIVGVVLVFHDIAERREAERKLEASEARFRRLFETANDGILIMDATEGRINDVNRCLMDISGYPREHFLGKQLWDLGIFQDVEAIRSAMQVLTDIGYLRYENLTLLDRDGRPIPVEFVCNRYHEDGHLVFQCNIRNISERKQVEREREALLAQEHSARVEAQAAERANRAKDIFLATLSHEMRTPLNAILGWATILRRTDRTPDEIREGIEVIERNAHAQTRLIEDVLDISRIVSGKLRLAMTACEFKSIVFAAVKSVQSTADSKGIKIDVQIDPEIAQTVVYCDGDRMQQVIWNLLANAVKFCARGAKVRIVVKRVDSDVQVAVIDNGPGIPSQMLPFVFDRFRQGDSSTTRRAGGLGLGLSIVKHLVELHGGSVKAENSEEGTGTIFTITFPIHAPQPKEEDLLHQSARSSEFSAMPIRLDGLKLLVVDDEPDARRLVSKLLKDAGADVTVAANVREALQVVEHEQRAPNVLISDLSMPEEDGFDLIRQIREKGHSVSTLPAVALTAFADKGYARSALLAGYQVHVPKPVDPNDLIAVVASLAGRTYPPSSTV